MDVRRPKTDADVEGLIRVHGLAWREAYDGILPDGVRNAQPVDPTAEDVDRWRVRLGDPRADAFVAVVDGGVRGFVDVRWGDANTKSFVGENEAELKAIYQARGFERVDATTRTFAGDEYPVDVYARGL